MSVNGALDSSGAGARAAILRIVRAHEFERPRREIREAIGILACVTLAASPSTRDLRGVAGAA